MNNKKITEPIYWDFTNYMLKEAMDAMDHRADNEFKRISRGESLEIVHGQAVRDYIYFVEFN